MSETLFKFVLKRPPVVLDLSRPAIQLAQESAFQGMLLAAAKTNTPYKSLTVAAQSFLQDSTFAGDMNAIPLAKQVNVLSAALDKLQAQPSLNAKEVFKAVENAFQTQDPKTLSATAGFKASIASLKDSLLAIKQLLSEHDRPVDGLVKQLRDLELVVKLAEDPNQTDPSFPIAPLELSNYRTRPIQTLEINIKSTVSDAEYTSAAQDASINQAKQLADHVNGLFQNFSDYHSAISKLSNFKGEHFLTTPQLVAAAAEPPAELNPASGLVKHAVYLDSLRNLNLQQIKEALPSVTRPPALAVETNRPATTTAAAAATTTQDTTPATATIQLANSLLSTPPTIRSALRKFTPLERTKTGFLLTRDAAASLDDSTKKTLELANINLDIHPVDRAVRQLQGQAKDILSQIDDALGTIDQSTISIKRVGNSSVVVRTPVASHWTKLIRGNARTGTLSFNLPDLTKFLIPIYPHGNVTPAGIADLLVVKQQLKGYELVDIAHIENVLKGEGTTREFTTTTTTTQASSSETETTTASTQDLESTTRYEMSKETDSQIKEAESLKGGVTVSGSYGPSVQITANVEGAMSRDSQTATKEATRFSQDITQKSSKAITQRVLTKTSLTTTAEVLDKNIHSLSNVGGSTNISGIYQFVNKVYEAQIWNYGIRTMYDFMIPEPAAFLIAANASAHAAAMTIEKPQEFNLSPLFINELIYPFLLPTWGANDVVAAPELYKSFAKEMSATGTGDSGTSFVHTDEITIDDGYEILSAFVGCTFNYWPQDAPRFTVFVGTGEVMFDASSPGVQQVTFPAGATGGSGGIPVAFNTIGIAQGVVTIEIKCQRTARTYEAWQLDTYNKLSNAHKARMQEYEEKLAQLKLDSGPIFFGTNPSANLLTMRTEIKKNCISILTNQRFDLFDAIDTKSSGYPQIKFDAAANQGQFVRFFEEAFEWEEMTWLTYPYFWGRKSNWQVTLATTDPDPIFDDFCKSGFCRASLPARLGWEGAIDHFLTYGELWNGGPLPAVGSKLYMPIAAEIAERSGKPGDEHPQGETWEVRIPTTLIKLRQTDELPAWTKGTDGTWKSN